MTTERAADIGQRGARVLAVLLGLLAATGVFYGWVMARSILAQRGARPTAESILVGAIVNFFDTLGIGSFAPTLAWLKLRTNLPDRLIPCTMIVGCTVPTILQSGIFLALLGVHVDPVLLIGYAVGLLLGGMAGAHLVRIVPIWIVQSVVGAALLIAAALYALANLHLMPVGGLATSLPVPLMALAIGASFIMGALLNFGVGHYAPSLLMLSLMGMDPRLVFPIMATAGALTGAVVSRRLIRTGLADMPIAVGFAIGSIPAVLTAALAVKDMPITWLRWLVIGVVTYAAIVMLRDAGRTLRSPTAGPDQRSLTLAGVGKD